MHMLEQQLVCIISSFSTKLFHNFKKFVFTDQNESNACKLDGWQSKENALAMFWPEGWRKQLCCCDTCLVCYTQLFDIVLNYV